MGWSWTIFLSSDAIFRSHKISQSQVKGLPKKDTLHYIIFSIYLISFPVKMVVMSTSFHCFPSFRRKMFLIDPNQLY